MEEYQKNVTTSTTNLERKTIILSYVLHEPPTTVKEFKWESIGPSGIVNVDGKNILTNYHSITTSQTNNTRRSITNTHAQQNTKLLYQCLEASISGSTKTTKFNKMDKLKEHKDGIGLFKVITKFTKVSSVQLSKLSLQQIHKFNTPELNFNIPEVNTKLVNVFVLATTQNRQLYQNEQIQHTINAYEKFYSLNRGHNVPKIRSNNSRMARSRIARNS